MDSRPICGRPHYISKSLWSSAVRNTKLCAGPAACGPMADRDGHDAMDSDEDESPGAGSRAAAHVRLHAADLHLHAVVDAGGPGDLLDLEQSSDGDAAIRRDAAPGRRGA